MNNLISVVSNVVTKPQNAQVAYNVVKNFFQTLPSPVKAINFSVFMENGKASSLTMKLFKNSIHFS